MTPSVEGRSGHWGAKEILGAMSSSYQSKKMIFCSRCDEEVLTSTDLDTSTMAFLSSKSLHLNE
jgi:hypothetical protein